MQEITSAFCEVAFTIGKSIDPSINIEDTLKAIRSITDSFWCGVYHYKPLPSNSSTLACTYCSNRVVPEAAKTCINENLNVEKESSEKKKFDEQLPLITDHGYCKTNIYELPEFGYLVIVSNGESIIDRYTEEVKALAQKFSSILKERNIKISKYEEQQRLNEFLNVLPEMVFEVDAEGKLTYMNETGINLLETSQTIIDKKGISLIDIFSPEERGVVLSNFMKSRVQEHKEPREYTVQGLNGRKTDVLIYTRRIMLNDKFIGVRGIALDITARKQAEQNQKTLNERLELALTGSEAGLWDWDIPTGKTYYNDRWISMLGYSREEIEGDVSIWESLVHPDDMPAVMVKLNKHLCGKTPIYSSEHRLKAKDGSWKWILDTGKVTERAADGKPIRAVGTHLDISEKKNAEETVQQHLKQQRLISEIAISLNSLDSFDSKINHALSLIGQHLNVSRVYIFEDDPNGKTTTNTYEWCNSGIESELKKFDKLNYKEIPSWKKIIKKNGMLSCNDTSQLPPDIKAITKDDQIISILEYPMNIEQKYAGFIGFDECVSKRDWTNSEHELIRSFTGIITNAFERRSIDRILNKNREKQRVLFENSPFSIVLSDLNASIIDCNKAFEQLTGMEKSALCKVGFKGLIKKDDFRRRLALIRRQYDKKGNIEGFNINMKTLEGEDKIVEVRGFFWNEDALPTKIWAIIYDVTEDKIRQQKLIESEEKFRKVFENSTMGIIRNNFEGKFLDCNQTILDMLGYTKKEFISLSYADIVPLEDYKHKASAIITKIRKEGKYSPTIVSFKRKDGKFITCSIHGSLIKSRHEEPSIWVNVQDITEEHQKKELLKASEERFRSLFNLYPYGITISKLDGELVECNDFISKMTGFNKSDLKGITPKTAEQKKDFSERHRLIFDSIKRSGRFGPVEFLMPTKQGSTLTTIAQGFTFNDINGEKRICTSFQDISEEKKRREELRISEEKFRSLFEFTPIGVTITDLHTRDYIEYNNSFLEMVGYTAEEFAGKTYFDVNPAEYRHIDKQIISILSKSKTFGHFEKEFIRKDGSRIPVLITGFSSKDNNGREIVWTGIQNISDLKQKSHELALSEKKFRGLFENLPIGVVKCDLSSLRIIEYNNAVLKMTGLTADELLQKSIWDFTPAPNKDIVRKGMEVALKEGRFGPEENLMINKNGNTVHLIANGFIEKEGGDHEVLWSTIQDISELKEQENKRKESEEKFRSFVENASDIILAISLQGEVLYVSPNIVKKLGYLQSDFSKKALINFVHPEDLSYYLRSVKDYLVRGLPAENMEFRMRHKNGEWRWMQVTTSINRDSYGNLYGIAILRDFTKDKIAQDELKRLSLVASKSTNMIVITNKNQEVEWVNDAFVEQSGFTREEMIGRIPGHFLQGKHTSQKDKERIHQGIKSGKPFSSEVYNYDKQGKGYWIEMFVTPIYDENNELQNYIAVENNITDRKEAEAKIAKLTTGIETSPAVFVITNSEGCIEYVNHRFTEVTGYSADEAIGRTPRILKSGRHSRQFYKNLWDTIKSGNSWTGEFYNKKKDGTFYWESATISPIMNNDNEITHFIAIKEDITEQKKMYDEMMVALDRAEAATRAKSEFLAVMSHEIRTPMNGVIGMTSLLSKTDLTDEQHDYVNTIRNSGDALLTIINDILDFSKIESGKFELENYPFDIRQCVEEVVDLFWLKTTQKHINLYHFVSPEIQRMVLGDITRLRQILVNLVGNAIKFTDKGDVSISVEVVKQSTVKDSITLKFTVKDTGVGIPADKQKFLFTPFMQVDASITRRFGGTGLGLAITSRLIQIMNSKIHVVSDVGKGSEFFFELEFCNTDLIYYPQIDSQLKSLCVYCESKDANTIRITHDILDTIGIKHTNSISRANLIITDTCNSIPPDKKIILITNIMEECKQAVPAVRITTPLKVIPMINVLNKVTMSIDDGKAQSVKSENSAKELASRYPVSILVAEDNTINQKLMNKSLEYYGYTADIAANGIEVLQALERQSYDLIFMDLQMPEMDGLEATRKILAKYSNSRPIIIAMTASALGADKDACFDAGMDDYVSKPIKIEIIEKMIVKWCANKQI